MTSHNSQKNRPKHSPEFSEITSLLEEALSLGLTEQDIDDLADVIDAQAQATADYNDVVTWAEANYYIEETEQPIELLPHQKAVLRYMTQRQPDGRFVYRTWIYSSIKKSGKTTIAGVLGRWAAETWGKYGDVLCVGNDAKQAQERAFRSIRVSLELTPGYVRRRQQLPGKWSCRTKELTNVVNSSHIRAIATDYQGEAGSNPSMIIWTELWGFIHRDALRFWAEMAPSPTRQASVTLIETYAGYEGESELLWQQYDDVVNGGRQLTAGELGDLTAFDEAPNLDSLIPVWVNDKTGVVAYWDEGEIAKRMPWQQGTAGQQYYISEEARQTPNQFRRLHKNEWVSAESEFVEMIQWDLCNKPLPLVPGEKTPLVVALDAAVSGDSFGLVVVSRDPERPTDGVVLRHSYVWEPETGKTIDFAGPEKACRELAANFNIVQFAYDPYQLHDMATRLMQQGVGWFYSFNQSGPRLIADKGFYDLIIQRRWRHDGDLKLRQHIANANKKQAANEDTKLRIVKKSANRRIDLAVCCSMAAAECLRLDLLPT